MKEIRFAKFAVLVNAAVPAVILGWDASHDQLGANPVNFAIRTTGMLALIFLMLSLVVTPARKLTGINDLIKFRRMLGLFAFFYIVIHFSLFFGLDRALSISSTLAEMIKRKYLIVGSIGLILFIPLAATSTDAMIRWLGAKRWKALHRLTYVIAIAGVVHFYMLVKADVRKPIAFGIVLGLLLGYRLLSSLLQRRSSSPKSDVIVGKPKFWKGQLRVLRITPETADVRTFRLASLDGTAIPFDFKPGQYLNLALNIDGKRVNRSYTIASSPTTPAYLELTIKREPQGTASRYMHDQLKEGDLLSASGPGGKFIFNGDEANSVVLVGGGVGITPLMSIVRSLADRAWAGEIHLLYCAKTNSDIIFKSELDALARRFPNLKTSIFLTREPKPDPAHRTGRITPDLIRKLIPSIDRELVYVCGPDAMLSSMRTMLSELGVTDGRLKFEAFSSPATALASLAIVPISSLPKTATVTFAASGKSATVAAGKTILELAEDVGINIDFDCRSGICGQCKTALLSGKVQMETQDALSDTDKTTGLILCCQAMALEDVAVDA